MMLSAAVSCFGGYTCQGIRHQAIKDAAVNITLGCPSQSREVGFLKKLFERKNLKKEI